MVFCAGATALSKVALEQGKNQLVIQAIEVIAEVSEFSEHDRAP